MTVHTQSLVAQGLGTGESVLGQLPCVLRGVCTRCIIIRVAARLHQDLEKSLRCVNLLVSPLPLSVFVCQASRTPQARHRPRHLGRTAPPPARTAAPAPPAAAAAGHTCAAAVLLGETPGEAMKLAPTRQEFINVLLAFTSLHQPLLPSQHLHCLHRATPDEAAAVAAPRRTKSVTVQRQRALLPLCGRRPHLRLLRSLYSLKVPHRQQPQPVVWKLQYLLTYLQHAKNAVMLRLHTPAGYQLHCQLPACAAHALDQTEQQVLERARIAVAAAPDVLGEHSGWLDQRRVLCFGKGLHHARKRQPTLILERSCPVQDFMSSTPGTTLCQN